MFRTAPSVFCAASGVFPNSAAHSTVKVALILVVPSESITSKESSLVPLNCHDQHSILVNYEIVGRRYLLQSAERDALVSNVL
jgi:hypothetical protein